MFERKKTTEKASAAKKHDDLPHQSHNDHPCKCTGNEITRSVGELTIAVRRLSFDIQQPLPYAIWGSLYLQTGFGHPLNPYIPSGVELTSSTVTPTGDLILLYTEPATGNQDSIQISTGPQAVISYAEAVQNLNTNYMRSKFMLVNYNAATQNFTISQQSLNILQDQALYLQKTGGLNDKDVQVIIPGSRKELNNSVPNILAIYLRNEPIKPESIWLTKWPYIADHPARAVITYTVFVSERIDMNSEKYKFD